MRAPLEFITRHVIYNPAYTYKFQLKTTIEWVLNPDESEVWRPAFKNLQILAEAQPKVYTQFIRPNLIIEIALNYPNSDADTYEKIAPGKNTAD
jgi:hypothetical protein